MAASNYVSNLPAPTTSVLYHIWERVTTKAPRVAYLTITIPASAAIDWTVDAKIGPKPERVTLRIETALKIEPK
jgi:hypothetical protein